MVGNGLRIGIQAAVFVIVARVLGAQGYGGFAGVVALTATAMPYAGWGQGDLLVKQVARYPGDFSQCWGRALLALLVTAGLLIPAVTGFARWLFPPLIPAVLVLYVAVADLLFGGAVMISAQAFQAVQRMTSAATLLVLLALARLVGAVAMLASLVPPTPLSWGGLYMGTSAAAAVVAIVWVSRSLGRPRNPDVPSREQVKEGFYFAAGASAYRTHNDFDKALLTRLSTLESAGIYSAAFRLVEVAFMPVAALLASSYPRFFQHGAGGIAASTRYARRLLPPALAYAVVAGAGIYLLAPVFTMLLGHGYESSAVAARWLAVMPLIGTFRFFAGNALTGSGHQGLRSALEAVAVAVNVTANLLLIPYYSWGGAVAATLISQTLLTCMLWLLMWRKLR